MFRITALIVISCLLAACGSIRYDCDTREWLTNANCT